MNKLFLAFIFAFVHGCGSVGIAQTTPNTQTYFQNLPTPVNLIKNPDARLNALDVQKTGTVVVTATAATGNSPTYFSIGAISTLGYAEFDLRPVKNDMTSGQCEFKGKYFGTEASKYSARIFNGTTEIIKVVLKNTTSALASGGPWEEFSVGAPCSSNPKVRIYADAVGLSLNVNRLYYDKATNIGSYTPPTAFTAKVSDAGFVSDQTPYAWINNFSVSSVVQFTASFISGTFTSAPNCVATMLNTGTSGQSQDFRIVTQTSTNLSIISQRASTLGTGFTVSCTKTGADAPQTVVRPETPRTPNIVRYTSGSGTYTPTPGTKYIIVEMAGGGGGGGAGGTASYGTATAGGDTTFGVATAFGGGAGAVTGITGNGGGSNVGTYARYESTQGTRGTGWAGQGATVSAIYLRAGNGGYNKFTGGGAGGVAGANGDPGRAETGGGGGGGCATMQAHANCGGGGGGGGYLRFKIDAPSAVAYSVGAGGTGATAGTSGFAGGAGGSGVIIITEYFSSDVNAIIAGNLYVDSVVKAEGPQGQNSAFEGSYTPTWSGLANVATLTVPTPWFYFRAMKTLFVFGSFDVSITAASTQTTAFFTLPSIGIGNFADAKQCSGSTINYGSQLERRGVINSVATTNNVRVSFMPGTYTPGDTQYVNFSCRIP